MTLSHAMSSFLLLLNHKSSLVNITLQVHVHKSLLAMFTLELLMHKTLLAIINLLITQFVLYQEKSPYNKFFVIRGLNVFDCI